MKPSKVILATGGTGGHVFPAIALAEELKLRGAEVFFLTDIRGQKYLQNHPHKVLACGNSMKQLHKIALGVLQSLGFYLKFKPTAVVGFGGYPSFAPLVAAKLLGRKIVLHEQNSVLGKVNRLFRKEILASSFKNTGGVFVGNPVRPEIHSEPYPAASDKINILVTGGSQGTKLFADILPKAFVALKDKIKITHQVREQELAEVQKFYSENGVDAELKPFFTDMPERLAKAHLVVCRSGSSTIAELCMVGRPAVFVPLAIAADNHQEVNAKSVCEAGGAVMILEKNFTEAEISKTLQSLDYNKLKTMAENIKKLAIPNSAKLLADVVLK